MFKVTLPNIGRYSKIKSIKELYDTGLNIHNMVITTSVTEALYAVCSLDGICSIRTDRCKDDSELDTLQDFPFFLFNQSKDTVVKLSKNLRSLEGKFAFILADGLKYEEYLTYNAVYEIYPNGDYYIEFCTEKVPLRHMYRYKTSIIRGNIGSWRVDVVRNTGEYDLTNLRRDMLRLSDYGIYNKVVEVTKYSVPVGIKSDEFVFWQVI